MMTSSGSVLLSVRFIWWTEEVDGMTLFEHMLGIIAMLVCFSIGVIPAMLYACVVLGSRADAHLERHWDGEKLI